MRKSAFPIVVGLIIMALGRMTHQQGIFAAEGHGNRKQKVNKVELEQGLFAGVLNKALDDWMIRLHIKDNMEKSLFGLAMQGKTAGSPDSITIFLFRPSATKEFRKTFGVRNKDQKFTLKMVKIRTPNITKPVGIIVYTSMDNGQMVIEESVLHFYDAKWHKLWLEKKG